MKLASLRQGRDGKLVVVSADLARYLDAGDVAPTLQAALDNWERVRTGLDALATSLSDPAVGEPFRPESCVSPLPSKAPLKKPAGLEEVMPTHSQSSFTVPKTWLRSSIAESVSIP